MHDNDGCGGSGGGDGQGFDAGLYADKLAPDGYEIPVVLRNTGARRGREVVQLHLARPDSAVDRPVRWPAGWAAVEAAPGERVTAYVPVSARALRYWSPEARAWVLESGAYTVLAGRSAGDLPLRATLKA